MDNRRIVVRFSAEETNFLFLQSAQIGPEAHPVCQTVGTAVPYSIVLAIYG